MTGLIDLLQAAKVQFPPNETKVHLACWNGRENPIEVYYACQFMRPRRHR